uniref:Autophagy-related protein 2 n=1 Tax=Bionectria ochroleuca TaxID=29856 RepID=A0A8H7TPR0_BIOOC
MTFELQGINADIVVYPEDAGETQSSVDVRVNSLDIFDHVPTSTWRKFATYDRDTGEREMGTSMLHLEILNVKPMPELVASESVLRVTVLPLRLHVDQDALDFLTRFFEFKDEKVPVHASPSDIPFVQRAEINSIPVKLDFKPKRVDYAGLRSGRTTEFMNFIVMDEARLVLRHVIIYGISGFDRLGKTLNDIWMPDVKITNCLESLLDWLRSAPWSTLVAASKTWWRFPSVSTRRTAGSCEVFQREPLLLQRRLERKLSSWGRRLLLVHSTPFRGQRICSLNKIKELGATGKTMMLIRTTRSKFPFTPTNHPVSSKACEEDIVPWPGISMLPEMRLLQFRVR